MYKKQKKKTKKLDLSTKQDLFINLFLNKDIFSKVSKMEIDEDFFQDEELFYLYLFKIVKDFYWKYEKLPKASEIKVAINASDIELNQSEAINISEFLLELKSYNKKELFSDELCVELLKTFFNENLTSNIKKKSETSDLEEVQSFIEKGIGNVNSILNREVTNMNYAERFSVKKNTTYRPFGVPWFDEMLSGGLSQQELVIIGGPTGGCKTTLSLQLSLELAKLEYENFRKRQGRGSLGISFFVSYEQSEEQMLNKAVAYLSEIDVNRLAKDDILSTANNLNQYDREKYAKLIEAGRKVPTETIRRDMALKQLSKNWALLDFSGMSGDNNYVGTGLLPEISGRIENDIQRFVELGKKRHVSAIFIDYIGLMAKRHCLYSKKDMSKELRLTISMIPNEARRLLCARFNCPVIILSQLNAEMNNLVPGILPKPMEFEESKTISYNCDLSFVIARASEANPKYTRIGLAKARRKWSPPKTLLVEGEFSRVSEARNISFDENNKRFINRPSKKQIEEEVEEFNSD